MIIDEIVNVCKFLDNIDSFNEKANDSLSILDQKISDLYHFLEIKNLNYRQCYKFCQELKSILNERRILKRNMSMYKYFSTNKTKLISGINNRKILLSNLYKEDKKWNLPYKNNIYEMTELQNIIES